MTQRTCPTTGTVTDTNIIQLGGFAIDLGAGTGGTGTQRTITDTASLEITRLTTLLTAFVAPGAVGLTALALAIQGWDGVNMQVLSVTAAGFLNVDTELPAALLLGDGMANPTVPGVASHLMGWVPGGAIWERIRSSGTGAIHTDLQLVDGAQPAFGAGLTSANTFRVVNAVGTATGALVDPDQTDAVVWAADANRKSTICQVVGTTQVLVREGAPTGGGVPATACCGRFNGGTLANDGTGQWFEVTSSSAVYLYDVAGAGNADVACTFEVFP